MISEALFDYNALMQQMLSTNATYLTVAVSVVLGTFILVTGLITVAGYLFAYKPFQKTVDQVTRDIEKSNDSITTLTNQQELQSQKISAEVETFENKLSTLAFEIESFSNDTKNQINEELLELKAKVDEYDTHITSLLDASQKLEDELANKSQQIKELKKETKQQFNLTEWESQWHYHYVWKTRGIQMNVFTTLVVCLRIAKKIEGSESIWRQEMPLASINDLIDTNLAELSQDEDWQNEKETLLKELDGLDKENEELIGKIKEALDE